MYFHNKSDARNNERTLTAQVVKARDFAEHQIATAMFHTVMVSNYESPASTGWTQNELRGYMAPEMGWYPSDRQALVALAGEALKDRKTKVYQGMALVPVTSDLREDKRFSSCPVGSVAVFNGVVDLERFSLNASMFSEHVPRGYFTSTDEFTVTDRVMAAPLFGRGVVYHGSEYTVGHLRQHSRDSLRKLNRELKHTYACVPFRSSFVPDEHTVWLQYGMRFDLSGEHVRILTAPEDTAPMITIVPQRGIRESIGNMLSAMLEPVRIANSVLNIEGYIVQRGPQTVYTLCEQLRHTIALDPTVHIAGTLNRALEEHGCQLDFRKGALAGPDGAVYTFAEQVNKMSYYLSTSSTSPSIYDQHQMLMLSILAVADKYELPPGLTFSLADAICTTASGVDAAFTSKAFRWLSTSANIDPLLDFALDAPETWNSVTGQSSIDPRHLAVQRFCTPQIARTRATYHSLLSTNARKKLVAKFPAV